MFNLTVSQDGTGDYTSIQEAINAIPDSSSDNGQEIRTIFIRNGSYNEKIVLDKPGVHLIGEDAEKTVITYGDYAMKKFADGSPYHTFHTYTLLIASDDIVVSNLTIENSAGRGEDVGQAIAVYVDGDRVAFYRCRFLGYQDTLFTGPLPEAPVERKSFGGPRDIFPRRPVRQYYEECYIEGDVDFIFGSATAVFNSCELYSKRRRRDLNSTSASYSYITAASTAENVPYGYVFWECRLTGDAEPGTVYLGRPWREHAKTAFINCELGEHIHPEGWHNWGKTEREQTVVYAEYGNTGYGVTGQRVKWSRQLSSDEVNQYKPEQILRGMDHWTPADVNSTF
ncbi:pectinesterase family protein [Neobacillus mesonae]|nr:pectinesterase family protein [Neobacillus mesonae]